MFFFWFFGRVFTFYCQLCNQGHYWAYVHHPARRVWLKFNDNTVSETTWDALKRESTGSRMNTSAYSLVNRLIVCVCESMVNMRIFFHVSQTVEEESPKI